MSSHFDDIGKLVLRNGMGLLMLFHGMTKVVNGYDHVIEDFAKAGFPAFLGHGVLVTEVLVPILLMVGYKARYAAVGMILSMITAVYLVHGANVLRLNEHGGWGIELNALFMTGALAIVFLGSGSYSVEAWLRRAAALPQPARVS